MDIDRTLDELEKNYFPRANRIVVSFEKDFTLRSDNTKATIEVYSNNGLETFAHNDLDGVLEMVGRRIDV
jgi:hypothetical protein